MFSYYADKVNVIIKEAQFLKPVDNAIEFENNNKLHCLKPIEMTLSQPTLFISNNP